MSCGNLAAPPSGNWTRVRQSGHSTSSLSLSDGTASWSMHSLQKLCKHFNTRLSRLSCRHTAHTSGVAESILSTTWRASGENTQDFLFDEHERGATRTSPSWFSRLHPSRDWLSAESPEPGHMCLVYCSVGLGALFVDFLTRHNGSQLQSIASSTNTRHGAELEISFATANIVTSPHGCTVGEVATLVAKLLESAPQRQHPREQNSVQCQVCQRVFSAPMRCHPM